MAANNDIFTALTNSRIRRENAETDAALAVPGNIQGRVKSSGNRTVEVETDNGGTLNVDNPSNQLVSAGDSLQFTSSFGAAPQLNLPGQSQTVTQPTARPRSIRTFLRAPTLGIDFGRPGDLWIHEKPEQVTGDLVPADLYRWSPLQGRFIICSNPTHEQNGYIEVPTTQSYPLVHSARYPSIVVGLFGSTGTTANLSIADGGVLNVGGTLTLEVTATDGDPYSFTVEYRRL